MKAVSVLNLLFILFVFGICHCQNIPFVKPSDCKETQFFDSSRMQCESCGESKQISYQTRTDYGNGLSCKCKAGYKFVDINSKGLLVCEPCLKNQIVSFDGKRCINCAVNSTSGICSSCYSNQIVVEHEINGSLESTVKCEDCTNGFQPDSISRSCVRCSQSFLEAGKGKCNCPPDKYAIVGDECLEKRFVIPESQSLYAINYVANIDSDYLRKNLQLNAYQCRNKSMSLACQHLANMCVLQLYGDLPRVRDTCFYYPQPDEDDELREHVPFLYYNNEASSILSSYSINTHYKFTSNSQDSRLHLVAAIYSINGTLLKVTNVQGGLFQLCESNFDGLDKAYDFGTEYFQKCSLKVQKLWNNYETLFFDLYIRYDDDGPQLYPLPVLIKNRMYEGKNVNKGSESGWKLVRRFTLVDNIGGVEYQSQGSRAKYIRFVKSFNIKITFQSSGVGLIKPPLVTLNYATAGIENYKKNSRVDVSFSINYFRSKWREEEDLSITLGVLGSLAALWAVVKTWSWSRRAGKEAIDFVTLMKFLIYMFDTVANLFFVVLFFSSLYQFVIFKRQDEAFLTLPTPKQEENLRTFIILIFIMKFLHVLHAIFCQATVDIFLLDWERPKELATKSNEPNNKSTNNKQMSSVSIWRTYFIANEWNELQGSRRINLVIQLLTVLLFLKVFGFEELTKIEPKASLKIYYWSKFIPYSQTLRFSVVTLLYILIALVQYGIRKLIMERFLEDPLQQFVDLCYLSNISVFILSNGRFGYYIHGRAGLGYADTDMREMYEQLKREEDDLCPHRGLLPNTDTQTFQVIVPKEIRNQYDRLFIPATSRNVQANRMPPQTGRGSGQVIASDIDRVLTSYISLNKFLAGFIDHAIRDIDYQIKDKLLLESILDIELYEVSNRGIFYNDGHNSFCNTLLMGLEWSLIMMEVLLFCVIDILTQDFILCAVFTFIISHVLKLFRKSWGRRNLARKTLIDQRFLI